MTEVAQYTACLEPYVGLKGLCEDIPGAYLVNDLPGVALRTFAHTATEEDKTARELFLRLRRLAAEQVAADFLHRLGEKYEVEEVAERRTLGDLDTNKLVPEGAFKLERYAPMLRLRLDKLTVYADRLGNATLTLNGVETTVLLQQGYNDIETDVTADTITGSLVGVDGLQLARTTSYGLRGTTAKSTGATYGAAQLHYVALCDQIVCAFAQSLGRATRFMTAALLMQELEYSDRDNPLARNGKESAGRIYASIMGTRDPVTDLKHDSKYYRELSMAVARAKLSGPCVSCTGQRIIESTP
ncbi:hypothetical protein LEM8419_03548 [Neolewinella maritima]|uniref:Uncharacterized protein n=1 Tax=Neolewinella maritima TaxID=1383882 RepID=A0ABM9B5K1_9BACT|nr:hypothetical protein [Neolewinella maritima]CAH1002676.1 hypothetical protein LEM8419_03548 [Neolewinella maritima]